MERDTPSPEPLHPTLKVPGRRALLQVPQKRIPYKEMPIPRAFSKCPSGSPAREPPSRFPSQSPHGERDTPSPEPLQPYLEVPVDETTSGCPKYLYLYLNIKMHSTTVKKEVPSNVEKRAKCFGCCHTVTIRHGYREYKIGKSLIFVLRHMTEGTICRTHPALTINGC